MKHLKMLSVAKKAHLIFPLLFILLISSCKKSESLNSGIPETTLNELRNWYASQKNISSQTQGSLADLVPIWEKVNTSEGANQIIYEVDLSNPNHIFTAKQVLDKKNLAEYERRSLFRLVFTKEKGTGTIHAAYMNIVADNGNQDIQAVRYKNATGFSGIVQYYNLNGSFNIGWHYANGKIDMKYTAFNRSDKGVHTEAIVPCGTTPRYANFCFELEGGGQSCESRVIGYDQKFCFVMSDNPVNPDGEDGGFEPGGPEEPTDNSKGKNFGVDPNCQNCKIKKSDVADFLAYAKGAGMTVDEPYHTTVTLENGETHEGTMTIIRDSNGDIRSGYFEPDTSSNIFEVGYIYNLGNGAPSTSGNTSSTPGPLYIGTGGQIVGFESQFPDLGGGASYTPSNSQTLTNLLGLNGGESIFLNGHPEIANAIKTYLDINGYTPENKEFGKWGVEYLNDNRNISIEDFKTQFLSPTIFDNLTSSVNAPDDPVIDNGIEIENLSGETPSSGRLLAISPNRGNTEDMTWGTNGNTAGIRSSIISQTNAELFAHMDRLFEICSINDSEMQAVSADFINVFRNNTGGKFSHSTLNRKVQESSSYKNYIKGFGKQLLTKLQAVNGDINSVAQFNLNNRPVFSGLKNKFNGLQILINDTEQTDIKIDNYNIDANGEFTVSLSVTIHDHFGLDKHDALTYQYKNLGFPAWWLLQHTRGYKPFETIINIKTRLHGHL